MVVGLLYNVSNGENDRELAHKKEDKTGKWVKAGKKINFQNANIFHARF